MMTVCAICPLQFVETIRWHDWVQQILTGLGEMQVGRFAPRETAGGAV